MRFWTVLNAWFEEHGRVLPWRGESDAYRIWLSEVILQQTRIEQGRDYYLRFVETYPTVQDLAAASEEEVLRLWQGLGYYTRTLYGGCHCQFRFWTGDTRYRWQCLPLHSKVAGHSHGGAFGGGLQRISDLAASFDA